MLANNIANAETGGYKADREFYSLYASTEASDLEGDTAARLPVIEKNYTDYSQGSMRGTSNQLDFGIEGKGFFAVNSPSGVAYTRNGRFQLTASGKLVTGDGYPVCGESGQAITLDPALPVSVAADGTIRQSGQIRGKLELVDFEDHAQLVKQGSTLFRLRDTKTKPIASTAQVQQGRLESSNVGSSESAIRLVSVMRQFDMLQKAAHMGQQMNSKAIAEVAKVGS